MKRIGIIGGMSWESTQVYYQLINEAVRDRLGGLHSAEIILYSVDFEPIERLQVAGDWEGAGQRLADAARRLEAADADFILLATNTMHKVAAAIEGAVRIPLLHIADSTAQQIRADGIERVGLLGTHYTMEDSFYRGRLEEEHGLEVLVPDAPGRETVHRVIFDELCVGRIEPASRQIYRQIITDLAAEGAQAVILGCTEISLLVCDEDAGIPLYDTTALHAVAAVDLALS